MSDPAYTVVKASARKGGLLTREQLLELSYSKDLKELAGRLKERMPEFEASALTAKVFEDALYGAYIAEVEEFMRISDKVSKTLGFFKREVEDTSKAESLKSILSGNLPEKQKEELLSRLKAGGLGREIEEASNAFSKYGILGLVDVIFAKHRLLDLCEDLVRSGGEAMSGLADFLKMKVDYFNVITIIRGIKNGVPQEALQDLLIYQFGSLSEERIKEAIKQGEAEKAANFIMSFMPSKGAGARDLEKRYEESLSKVAQRAYYRNYSNLAAVFAYLELKLRETKNLIRLANIIERGLDPKRSLQEFIY
ncbi:MAG: V-type ATPase subunit [Candidatus Methanosuratus sp.]|nr:V-type ATPase subunit [Candidatus Methanosuratincola sp.]